MSEYEAKMAAEIARREQFDREFDARRDALRNPNSVAEASRTSPEDADAAAQAERDAEERRRHEWDAERERIQAADRRIAERERELDERAARLAPSAADAIDELGDMLGPEGEAGFLGHMSAFEGEQDTPDGKPATFESELPESERFFNAENAQGAASAFEDDSEPDSDAETPYSAPTAPPADDYGDADGVDEATAAALAEFEEDMARESFMPSDYWPDDDPLEMPVYRTQRYWPRSR